MKKGLSPAVSFTLVLAIIVATAITAYLWSINEINSLGESGRVMSYQNQMIGLDYAIRSVAHGDINFQNVYEMHLPDASLVLRKETDMMVLYFRQRSGVLGAAPVQGSSTCTAATEFVYDTFSKISTYRESNTTRVFQGAKGAGAGEAEFLICYYNIDLQFGGNCTEGKAGPKALVYIKKVNVTTKPVVNIEIC